MIIIFAIDGLEYDYVRKFNCRNLMQDSYGKTDISEFEKPRTVVIWSSFLAEKNLESTILNQKVMWDFKLEKENTFLRNFKKIKVIDLPGFSYMKEEHAKERLFLKEFFEKKITVEEYDNVAFENYKKVKQEFSGSLKQDFDLIVFYIALADVIGHLSFGLEEKMRLIYNDLDLLVASIKRSEKGPILVISDHGMEAVGRFGDHSDYGFWSFNQKIDLNTPKITEIINKILFNKSSNKISK